MHAIGNQDFPVVLKYNFRWEMLNIDQALKLRVSPGKLCACRNMEETEKTANMNNTYYWIVDAT